MLLIIVIIIKLYTAIILLYHCYFLQQNLPSEIKRVEWIANNNIYSFWFYMFFAVVVSNTTRYSALFFANQLRVDVGWRFLSAHSSCVRLYVWRYFSPMVLDVGLVNSVGRNFSVHITANYQWSHIRVSKTCNMFKKIIFLFLARKYMYVV